MRAQAEADYVNFGELQAVVFVQALQQECELFADESRVGRGTHITATRQVNEFTLAFR